MFRNAYKLASVLTAQNAGAAQTCVGVTYLSFMNIAKADKCALYVTTDTFAHGPKTSTFAFHGLVKTKHLLLRNTILALTKQQNTE